MIPKLIFIPALTLLVNILLAQENLPVIKATSKKVDIRDGDNFKKGDWNITPDLKPDVYTTSSKRKIVTFYTDIDSISFRIKPNKKYNFIILLNGKDSAYTQIKYEHNKYVSGYLDILKKASKYNFNDNREITKFTYKSVNDTDLVVLRKEFKLDSITGKGNELSRILNMMHWVHNTFQYDGSREIPDCSSLFNLMTVCIQDHKTLHCGGMAEVLNDCYLALGFKSRRVVCLPKDSTDFDCHSINSVYSETMKKWLWIDPTNDAYVMNEKGELLSITEVRERLVNNKPLILNPEANLNHAFSRTKNEYLCDYMAKNLYAIQCYVSGGGESLSNLLLPVEYKGIIPRTKVNKPKCTNNPEIFWAKPE
ncbi:MAG: transglutaminase domain-containing protein [Bacteroidales bacterium]